MNSYVTGPVIRRLREARGLTQAELADKVGVSSKAVSKWETAKGLPDISLLQPLAGALGVSVIELMSGAPIVNRNVSCNLTRSKLYVCPICGNVIHCAGDTVISCCGVTLPACEAEEMDGQHAVSLEQVEDEVFLHMDHPMTKSHYISFVAFETADRLQLVKLYPEGNAETRLQLRGHGLLYVYCNQHGLMKKKI